MSVNCCSWRWTPCLLNTSYFQRKSLVCKITLVNWIGKSGLPSLLQILASALTTTHSFQSSETLISSCGVGNILCYSCNASEISDNMQNHKWINLTSSCSPTNCAAIGNTESKPQLLYLGTKLTQMQRSLAECLLVKQTQKRDWLPRDYSSIKWIVTMLR